MSGIVGILNEGGPPVDRELLAAMTNVMSFRGPDAQEIWVQENVGLGHAMLRTTDESERESQPCTLEGQVWITADARVDARNELVRELNARGRNPEKTATDPELILHAYHTWAEDCVQHLLGDFAFAIWDARERRLFCARDHFGVKPFFYSRLGDIFLISNTLECLRRHPNISDELNERSIGDFLIFDYNADLSSTTFLDIQRLPPAHSLMVDGNGVRVRRYWKLPVDERVFYRRANDYVEHFRHLMRAAVSDRLRTQKVAVLMSGGLDSTTVAATACELVGKDAAGFVLKAITNVFDVLIPDEERHYAGVAAKGLGIPIDFVAGEGYRVYENRAGMRAPEPKNDPLAALDFDFNSRATAHSRVALCGNGADTALTPSALQVFDDARNMRWLKLARETGSYLRSHRRLPQVGIRTRLRESLGRGTLIPYPTWLKSGFEARWQLKERWREVRAGLRRGSGTLRPEAYGEATGPYWPSELEKYDASSTGLPLEVRHPFFDLRVLEYCFAIPHIPWCVDKLLLRSAAKGALPEEVRLRPKAPLAGFPILQLLRDPASAWVDAFTPVGRLCDFVERRNVPALAGSTGYPWVNLRPLSLNIWLENLENSEHDRTSLARCEGCW